MYITCTCMLLLDRAALEQKIESLERSIQDNEELVRTTPDGELRSMF